MAKVKIKCASCGKTFKSPDAKRTLCPDCQAARKAAPAQRAAGAPAAPAAPAFDVRAAFRAAQSAGSYAAYGPAPAVAEPPPEAAAPTGRGPRGAADTLAVAAPAAPAPVIGVPEEARPEGRPPRGVAPAGAVVRPSRPPSSDPVGVPARGSRREPPTGRTGGEPRPPRPAPAPKPPRERKPPTPPFVPSEEQAEAIRLRYLELAQPEFDGIRHQIAHEMGIPIRAVKDVVKELRAQMRLPSWWELAAAALTDEQRAAVRDLYVPQLPLPEVGIHKRIADELKLKPLAVYSAIRTIREEMGLPRYNERPDHPAPGAPTEEGEAEPATEPLVQEPAEPAEGAQAGAPGSAQGTLPPTLPAGEADLAEQPPLSA